MCTAFSCCPQDHYFGRNLDLDYHYDEKITITPRKFRLPFRHVSSSHVHLAMIGVSTNMDGFPLYYDAVNEKGLCMAGLNFPGNAVYGAIDPSKDNIASFELIPWVLGRCESVDQAKACLETTNICNTSFCESLPPTPLHWLISDRERSITVEPTKNGLRIIDNPTCILTNNPPFDYHLQNLTNYMHVTAEQATNHFSKNLEIKPYSLGMGGIGLPGDFSSGSRFIRCAFMKENSFFGQTENDRVSQVFHILDSVSQFEGCVKTPKGYEKTIYSICCNATKGIFYYTTYFNRQISAVNIHNEVLSSQDLITYPLFNEQIIKYQN